MGTRRSSFWPWLAWCLWLVTALAPAAELTVHGFGTIGVAYLDKPADWAYSRALNQRTSEDAFRADLDTVLGLQANYRPSQTLELVGQVSASALDREAPLSEFVELAFLAWRPDQNWSVRLGRVNLDAYLISNHRDVGYTYPFIRPPVEFYARSPTSLDGGDVTRTWDSGSTQWQAKLFAGRTAGGTGDGRLRLSPVVGLMVSRESDGLLLRISAVHARSANDIVALKPLLAALQQVQMLPDPQVAQEAAGMQTLLTYRGTSTNYVAAAAAYDRHDWLLSAEINRSTVKGNPTIGFTSGYASVGRRFGSLSVNLTESGTDRRSGAFHAPDWETALAYMGSGQAQQFQAIADGAAIAINTNAGHQFTTSLGVRWDVNARLALKAQLDRVRTPRNGSALWNLADQRPAVSHVMAVAADFVF